MHGPYYHTEHSKEKGSKAYEISKAYFIKTLELSKQLNSKYIVYHHNNCSIESGNREERVYHSSNNLLELNKLSEAYGVNIVVENAGVLSRNNMLFNQEQFIEMAKGIDNKILIDIGHAFANSWDLDYVIGALKNKIEAYHLHNNDGVEDTHSRIRDGKLSIEHFFECYKKYTPKANLVIEYSKNCTKDVAGIIKDVNEIKQILKIHS